MERVKRVYIAHTINTVALSVISVYVPIYLLTLGFPLSKVILFYVISHIVGLLFGLFLFLPLVQRWGIINTFKIYYPVEILYLLLLTILKANPFLFAIVAITNGIALFAYWIPMNIFLVKYSNKEKMGTNLSKFFALPNLFSVVGPLIGAASIPVFGFWPVFAISILGMITSFLPLAKIEDEGKVINLNFSQALKRLSRSKTLFIFEFFDNIIEESEWFWSIYVFIMIGSLATPGIIGSLEAIGGSLFTLIIGKYINYYGKKIIPFAALLLFFVIFLRIFINQPTFAYASSVMGSFALTLFLVTYFSTVYKTIKNDNEEEFMILREIPTVGGRIVIFGFIYLTLFNLRYFFILPLSAIFMLLALFIWKGKHLAE